MNGFLLIQLYLSSMKWSIPSPLLLCSQLRLGNSSIWDLLRDIDLMWMKNKCRCDKNSGWSDENETKKKTPIDPFMADNARFSMFASSKDFSWFLIGVLLIIELFHSRYLQWLISFVLCLSNDDWQFCIIAVRDRLFLARSIGLKQVISLFSINESRR